MFWILLVRFAHFVYIVWNILVRIAECLCVVAEFISANFTLIRTNKFRTFLFRTILFSHFLIPLRYFSTLGRVTANKQFLKDRLIIHFWNLWLYIYTSNGLYSFCTIIFEYFMIYSNLSISLPSHPSCPANILALAYTYF